MCGCAICHKIQEEEEEEEKEEFRCKLDSQGIVGKDFISTR